MEERERYNNISQVIFDQQQQRFQIYYSGGVMVFEALMEAMRRCDSRLARLGNKLHSIRCSTLLRFAFSLI